MDGKIRRFDWADVRHGLFGTDSQTMSGMQASRLLLKGCFPAVPDLYAYQLDATDVCNDRHVRGRPGWHTTDMNAGFSL